MLRLGVDIGSVSVNTVLMEDDVVEDHYDLCHGRPFPVLRDRLRDVLERRGGESIGSIALTGSGGELASRLIGGVFVNEIIAQAASVSRLFPLARTIIEMGGEDTKLISLRMESGASRPSLSDFVLNTICAAGTGSFLDQQAKRLGVSIQEEFGALALRSASPPRIAGRCSVFAKSDMIHLQQIATPVNDIVAGLCFAVARNVKSTLCRGRKVVRPVIFQGGVAANAGMVRAFREVFALSDGELIIPPHHASMGAIGAILHGEERPASGVPPFLGLSGLERYLERDGHSEDSLPPLRRPSRGLPAHCVFHLPASGSVRVSLGVDVGSLSTNVVLIDDENRVLARSYLPTASRPLEAIQKGLAEVESRVGGRVEVMAAGSTGSGRYLTGDFIGADVIQNEITAQATATLAHDPRVDTIFEIGGQDSKYISLDNGVIVDFEMNKVCAAGTGSFLEEQAEKLNVDIVGQFSSEALGASEPARLGDRCTVFMESDLNTHQQRGARRENLIAGLAYSIVQNYLQKVVGAKRIGDRIYFQGGVANNEAVVSAFEHVTGKPVIVPPHFDVTGAIGAAMLARDAMHGARTRFKGFAIARSSFTLERFTCTSCANQCEIRRVRIAGDARPLYYGGRCERWEAPERKGRGKGIPNLFAERERLFMEGFAEQPNDGRPSIGVPRALAVFHQQFPFWAAFFRELGFRLVISDPTTERLVAVSSETLVAETCLPVEVVHGHVLDVLAKGADYVFLPFIINASLAERSATSNYNCPWVQTYPFMVRSALRNDLPAERFLVPRLHFRYGRALLARELADFFSRRLGVPRRSIPRAMARAFAAQGAFESAVRDLGRSTLEALPANRRAFVILGRPYSTEDPALNLRLVEKLIDLDVLPIPMDFLPLDEEGVLRDYPSLYWPNGRRIIAAARAAARDERLHVVHLSNFRCGPDSFLSHYLREELAGRPFLQLEIDEHSADAGLVTRCEAFLDSLHPSRGGTKRNGVLPAAAAFVRRVNRGSIVYIPYMCDHAEALAASCRACGVEARVLPPLDAAALEWGRRFTSSRECFPMICTTGSFLQKMNEPGFVPSRSTFFMPDHNGPCRFGQYNRLQRIVFERLGYGEVRIISPSNSDAYEELSVGQGNLFRLSVWKGMVAIDILRKLLQERRPYEKNRGEVESVYRQCLDAVISSIEGGAKDMPAVLARAIDTFCAVPRAPGPRRPVISVAGEIFMRDNPSCNGSIVPKLESFGAEICMAPLRDWLTYSSLRYARDSGYLGDWGGLLKARIQIMVQETIEKRLVAMARDAADMHRDIHVGRMLRLCSAYIDGEYDGDPAITLGSAEGQYPTGISGVVHILPFTCMPGTVVSAVSPLFSERNGGIPWINIAYDGQEDAGMETRLQAFVYRAEEFARRRGLLDG